MKERFFLMSLAQLISLLPLAGVHEAAMDLGQFTPLVERCSGVLHGVDQAAVLAAEFSLVVFKPPPLPKEPQKHLS